MSLFFTPNSKIQKDRAVLRQIDSDLARRSLPGVFSYFLIYLVIDFVMGYPEDTRLLSFVFGLVALVVAIARIFVALGFDSQYARGPARWRRIFLWLSMINAVIWSGMLCFVLIRGEFSHVFTLALVYTAALTAGITTVYAQYIRFVQIYLCVVLVPSAFILLFKLNMLDAILGVGVFAYLGFLLSEGAKYYKGFWARIDSQAQLEQKIALLNVSRMESAQRADIHENALSTVMEMIKPPMQGVLGMLSMLSDGTMDPNQKRALSFAKQSGGTLSDLMADIEEFNRLRDGHVQLSPKFFDLRRFAEDSVEKLGSFSHSHALELSFLYNIDVPSRISLDKKKVGQIIKSMVVFAIAEANSGEVVFKVAAAEEKGLSKIKFCAYFDTDSFDIAEVKSLINNMRIDPKSDFTSYVLSLMVASRLVELMGGKLEFRLVKKGVYSVQVTLPMEVSSQQIDAFKPEKVLNGKKIAFLDMPERAGKGLSGETGAWGMLATVRSSSDIDALASERPDFILLDIPVVEEEDASIARVEAFLASVPDDTKLFLYGAVDDSAYLAAKFPKVAYINKPAGRYSLHAALFGAPENVVDDADAELMRAKASKRILLADENPINRLVTSSLLKNLGYQYNSVSTGSEMLDRLENDDFDMVLVSSQLRNTDALDATRRIRSNELNRNAKIPILGLTSKISSDEDNACLTSGMTECIAIPLTLPVLEEALARWLVFLKSANQVEKGANDPED